MIIEHETCVLTVQTHAFNKKELMELGVALGVALAMRHPSNLMPYVIYDGFDDLDGHQITVIHKRRKKKSIVQ